MLNILFVDDDPIVHKIAQAILEPFPCQVLHAFSGSEAKENISKHNINIIFMDIFMPGENGIECARSILKKHPKHKIIGMTGHNSEEHRIKALGQGMKFFFFKPLDKSKILASIQLHFPEFSIEPKSPISTSTF